ncbi:hypothetical protein CHS0354_030892 [Potamilus streckersoni]|uniref:Uncharacterized protein n=1 Tax=Potamilus streckersoni TaxID=2493646 RepID=A0AAE0SAB6_9BIVA|nr:hypothetical protein CHS0354_030892 [Potamilus streckersoni]
MKEIHIAVDLLLEQVREEDKATNQTEAPSDVTQTQENSRNQETQRGRRNRLLYWKSKGLGGKWGESPNLQAITPITAIQAKRKM